MEEYEAGALLGDDRKGAAEIEDGDGNRYGGRLKVELMCIV